MTSLRSTGRGPADIGCGRSDGPSAAGNRRGGGGRGTAAGIRAGPGVAVAAPVSPGVRHSPGCPGACVTPDAGPLCRAAVSPQVPGPCGEWQCHPRCPVSVQSGSVTSGPCPCGAKAAVPWQCLHILVCTGTCALESPTAQCHEELGLFHAALSPVTWLVPFLSCGQACPMSLCPAGPIEPAWSQHQSCSHLSAEVLDGCVSQHSIC